MWTALSFHQRCSQCQEPVRRICLSSVVRWLIWFERDDLPASLPRSLNRLRSLSRPAWLWPPSRRLRTWVLPNETSWRGCGARTSNSVRSATSCQKPRPRLHERQARCRQAPPVHGRKPSLLFCCQDGGRARRFQGGLLCLGRSDVPGSCRRRCRTTEAGARGLRQTYGALRVHAELPGCGEKHGRKRIARLMRQATLLGTSHPKGGPVTTRRDQEA